MATLQALQKTMRLLEDNRCEQNGHYGHEKRLEASCSAALADLKAAEEAKEKAIQACEGCIQQAGAVSERPFKCSQVGVSRQQVTKDLQAREWRP